MKSFISGLGTVAGLLGVLFCIAALAGRFYGDPAFLGYKALSIFHVGVGLMVFACFAKLQTRPT